jgi:hypothetical protein
MSLGRLASMLALAPLAACAMPTASPGESSSPASGDWACAASPNAAEAQPPGGPLSVRVREAYSGLPVTDADVTVCDGTDQDCTAPYAHTRVDATGSAQLASAGGPSLSGAFLRITGSEIATHYVFLAGRASAEGSTSLDVDVYIPAAIQAMAQLAGVAWDPASPLVRIDAQDCAGVAASGVTVSIGSFGTTQPVVAYLDGGGRPTRRTFATDTSGIALGFVVSAGDVGVADLLDGKPVGGGLGFARAGAVSMIVVRP